MLITLRKPTLMTLKYNSARLLSLNYYSTDKNPSETFIQSSTMDPPSPGAMEIYLSSFNSIVTWIPFSASTFPNKYPSSKVLHRMGI